MLAVQFSFPLKFQRSFLILAILFLWTPSLYSQKEKAGRIMDEVSSLLDNSKYSLVEKKLDTLYAMARETNSDRLFAEYYNLHGTLNKDLAKIKDAKVEMDIFTFSQKLPDTAPKYDYFMEWDNVAAISITTFDQWWTGLPQATRKNVRRSAKRGVEIRIAEFDDELIKGIVKIYNETPIRQGRAFWHYGKDFDATKQANSTYLSTCDFLGAYIKDELIGFMKLVYAGKEARIMQIISMDRHQDKRPTNALIAKAVELAEAKKMDYFIYGKYIYGNRRDTSIIEYKNRNGFQMIEIPKYYVPLTMKGNIALKCGLQHGIIGLIPGKVKDYLSGLRAKWYNRGIKKTATEEAESGE